MTYQLSAVVRFCLIVYVFGGILSQSQAQTVEISAPLIETAGEITNVYWTPDSQHVLLWESLVISDRDESAWYNVSLNQNQTWRLTEVSVDQAQSAMLSETLEQASQAIRPDVETGNADNGEGLVIASPNPNYFVYVGEWQKMGEGTFEGGEAFYAYPLILVDVGRNQSIVVPNVYIWSVQNANRDYQINWSADGTAFTVSTVSNFAAENIHYVTGYAKALDDISTVKLTDVIPYGITYNLASLSTDGSQVILEGIVYTPESVSSNLLIWNADHPETIHILTEGDWIKGLSFDQNETHILFIGKKGLQKINIQTREIILLDATLNSNTVSRAWFSPDREHIAMIRNEGDVAKLFITDIP